MPPPSDDPAAPPAPRASVALFESDPALARSLSAEARDSTRHLRVPALDVAPGEVALPQLLADQRAFGAIIVEGMMLQRFAVADGATATLYGAGDPLGVGSGSGSGSGSMLLSPARWTAAAPTRLALLDGNFLAYARRWPGLIVGLFERGLDQAERSTVQLAIAHLPRVEDRLLSVLWWLAETWGRVTASGTLLPIRLTHDGFGALVGARRSTVTLALGQLTERGAILHVDHGWLLLERPPAPPADPARIDPPSILAPTDTGWRAAPTAGRDPEARRVLLETVRRLRTEHVAARGEIRARVELLRRRRAELTAHRPGRETARRHAEEAEGSSGP
jgi:CRP/FNR family cyclic AMP-dependent transcriptional regulator